MFKLGIRSLTHISLKVYPHGQIGWRPESIPTLNKKCYTQKSKRRNRMEKKFIRVDEVAKELEISESHAYKIMRK